MDHNASLWLGRVTPAVHYCQGGLATDAAARVLDASGAPVPRLYAAGEVSGGLHGANRLGGNSLAECLVFGRIAGQAAAAAVAPRVSVSNAGGLAVDMMSAERSVAAVL